MTHWSDLAWNENYEREHGTSILFREVTTPKAAIEHICQSCQGTITVGISYVREVFMSRGDTSPTVIKQHAVPWDCEDH